MHADPKLLEEQAYSHLSEEDFQEAFKLFRRVAEVYRSQGNHKQAALCFASAATCWSKKSGEKTFHNAAVSYEKAAKEAELSYDYEYASLLYRHAAINHERDGEYHSFSGCFYRSKESLRRFLTYRFIHPRKINSITVSQEEKGIKGFIKRVFLWFMLTFSFLIWGHGERPSRTFSSAIFIVSVSAFFYTLGNLIKDGAAVRPDFPDAFYFSVVTFTTLGYGDIAPVGFCKAVAIFESFSGLFLVSLFIIGLSRKYLRV